MVVFGRKSSREGKSEVSGQGSWNCRGSSLRCPLERGHLGKNLKEMKRWPLKPHLGEISPGPKPEVDAYPAGCHGYKEVSWRVMSESEWAVDDNRGLGPRRPLQRSNERRSSYACSFSTHSVKGAKAEQEDLWADNCNNPHERQGWFGLEWWQWR